MARFKGRVVDCDYQVSSTPCHRSAIALVPTVLVKSDDEFSMILIYKAMTLNEFLDCNYGPDGDDVLRKRLDEGDDVNAT